MPSAESLKTRAAQLIDEYPLLKGCVLDGRTTAPQWGVRSNNEVASGMDRLVRDAQLDSLVGIKSISLWSNTDCEQPRPTVEDVIAHELDNDQELRVSANGIFLWRVVRYTSNSPLQPGFLAVTINHAISDGKSGLAIFNALLSPPDSDSVATGKPADENFPPSMESTVDCRPGYRYMTKVIWNELIVPRLPSFIAGTVKQATPWPGQPPSIGDVRRSYKLISLDAAHTATLKANGKRHRVDTLQPILEMATVVSLWLTFGAYEIAYGTPISVRDVSRGHSPLTGNYVGNLESRISCSTIGDDDFWERARESAVRLKSDAGRRQAISAMGMLAHIPDGLNDVSSDSPTPTGWETFLVDKKTRAPDTSFEVSNLGYTQLPQSASSVTFAQTPNLAFPVCVNAIGHAGGLSLLVGWRAGAYAQGDLDGGDFAKVFESVLSLLARIGTEDTQGSSDRFTFDDIRKHAA
jgi:hypothetical protein